MVLRGVCTFLVLTSPFFSLTRIAASFRFGVIIFINSVQGLCNSTTPSFGKEGAKRGGQGLETSLSFQQLYSTLTKDMLDFDCGFE